MKTETAVAIGLFGFAAYIALRPGGIFAPAPSSADRLRAQLFALPPAPTWQERQAAERAAGDVGVAEGAVAGAQAGAIGGPWGIAIGAGGGALYGWLR